VAKEESIVTVPVTLWIVMAVGWCCDVVISRAMQEEKDQSGNNETFPRKAAVTKRSLQVSIPALPEEDETGSNDQTNKVKSISQLIVKPTTTTTTPVASASVGPVTSVPQHLLAQQQILSEQLMQKIQDETSTAPATVPVKRPRGRPPLSSKNKG
jgi:hypothetical protein